jgi:hypothetical protein
MDFGFHHNNVDSLDWTGANIDEWDGATCARRSLAGVLVAELRLLPALETLDLAQSHTEASLDSFYSLKFLKNLYRFDSPFVGSIRNRISRLTRLERII